MWPKKRSQVLTYMQKQKVQLKTSVASTPGPRLMACSPPLTTWIYLLLGPHKTYSRIDFLTLQCVLDWRPKVLIGTKVLSDYAPVFVSMRLPQTLRPESVWRLNKSLLKDSVVLADIRETVLSFLKDHHLPADEMGNLEMCFFEDAVSHMGHDWRGHQPHKPPLSSQRSVTWRRDIRRLGGGVIIIADTEKDRTAHSSRQIILKAQGEFHSHFIRIWW